MKIFVHIPNQLAPWGELVQYAACGNKGGEGVEEWGDLGQADGPRKCMAARAFHIFPPSGCKKKGSFGCTHGDQQLSRCLRAARRRHIPSLGLSHVPMPFERSVRALRLYFLRKGVLGNSKLFHGAVRHSA